ncbi:MAG: hypothetical protein C4532_00480 [Candidatus Abyssobacteria bacterium SURF_17]|uniref:Uncharacterized protein n=1 Tax=Candidatus Abyssobacteria bacterium SURF_17 TaxID=2093361 RepID=A0A419F9Y3_9BACT|nr:MAG: hypothetical protein C4532_00480 [Candidatus Abyssubacteria bacterium SURF_17]
MVLPFLFDEWADLCIKRILTYFTIKNTARHGRNQTTYIGRDESRPYGVSSFMAVRAQFIAPSRMRFLFARLPVSSLSGGPFVFRRAPFVYQSFAAFATRVCDPSRLWNPLWIVVALPAEFEDSILRWSEA